MSYRCGNIGMWNEIANRRAQNIWMMELSFSSRAVGKPEVSRELSVCRDPETPIATWPMISLLFSASQSDCLFVSAAFQDDELSKNVLVFSRKGGLSYSMPSYLRTTGKWTASLSLNLTHGLMSKKNSNLDGVRPCIRRCCLSHDCLERDHMKLLKSGSRPGSKDYPIYLGPPCFESSLTVIILTLAVILLPKWWWLLGQWGLWPSGYIKKNYYLCREVWVRLCKYNKIPLYLSRYYKLEYRN